MGIYFEGDDPENDPWCDCGGFCPGDKEEVGVPRGWCLGCEEWAVSFNEDWTLVKFYQPETGEFGSYQEPGSDGPEHWVDTRDCEGEPN